MISRRLFLQGLSASTMLYLVPKKARAQISNQPLYITVEAQGGWDPTILMDPKSGPAFTTMYTPSDIVTLGGLSFLPRTGGGSPAFYEVGPDGDRQSFFHKYQNDLLVVNGIDTQTNSHDIGPRHTFSGNSRDDAPNFCALVAGVREEQIGSKLPLGFLATGGFSETRGLIPTSKAGNEGPVIDLARPNAIDNNNENPTSFFTHPSAYARLRQAEASRFMRQNGDALLPRVKWALSEIHGARAVEEAFAPVTTELNGLPALTPIEEANYALVQSRLAMAAMAAGVCGAAHVSGGGFDTHDNLHNTDHPASAQEIFEVVDYIWRTAGVLGFQNRLTIIVGSDFGRTVYNDDSGKDHWPITSMMFLGAGVAGGRTLGLTGDNIEADGGEADGHIASKVKVQSGTLVPCADDDPDGLILRPGHVHQALRAHAQIATHPHAVRFPLADLPASPLPIFG